MARGHNAWRGVVMALGFIGTLVAFFGLLLALAGGHILLPGPGILISGPALMLAGFLIIGLAIVVDEKLSGPKLS